MRNCNIGSTYANLIFGGLRFNNSIETLDLANNSIGNQACGTLALVIKEKREFEKLTIVLRSNQIGNQGYEQIK